MLTCVEQVPALIDCVCRQAGRMGKNWIPLEANPEVLNEYAQKIGVAGTSYAFTDVYGLDEVRTGRGARLNCIGGSDRSASAQNPASGALFYD